MAKQPDSGDSERKQKLRQRAEEMARISPANVEEMTAEQVQRLIHELQIHQVELEIQNEELRATQVELAESRDRYSALYDFAPVGYLELDKDSRILEANLTAATMLGILRNELLKTQLTKFISRTSQDKLYLHRQLVLSSGIKQCCEVELNLDAGNPKWVRLESVSSGTGPSARWRTALINVTDQKRAENALHQLNETLEERVAEQTQHVTLLAKAISHLGEGVLITGDDLDWPGPQILFVNEAMCRITGYSADELIGQTPRILQNEHTRREAKDQIKEDLSKGMASLTEMVNCRKDGTLYDAEVFITPLFDSAGRRTHFVSIHRDISKRKQAEQALIESEARLRLSVRSANIGLWDWSLLTNEVHLSPEWKAQIGYTDAEIPAHLEEWRSRLHPDDSELVMKRLGAFLEFPRRRFEIEYRLRHKDGSYRWIRSQGDVVKDDTGKPVRMLGSNIDITERQKAQEALKAREAQLYSFVQQAPVAIAMFDREMNYLAASQQWALDYGNGHDALTGVNHYVLHPDIPAHWKDIHQQGLAGQTLSADEDLWIRANGQQLWVRWAVRPWIDAHGEVGGIMIMAEDITVHKQAKLALKESEERLRAILATALDPIITIDRQGTIQTFNAAAELAFGYLAEEIVGQNVKLLMPEPYQSEHDEYLHRYRESGQKRIIGVARELIALRKDGSTFPMELSIAEVDHLGLFTGIIRDLTERKELQRHLLEIVAEEQRRIGYELHDGTAQELTGLSLIASTLHHLLTEAPDAIVEGRQIRQFDESEFDKIVEITSKLIHDLKKANQHVRELSHGIMPVQVDAEGLQVALQELANATNLPPRITCHFDCPTAISVANNTTAMHLYRIAQEAVNNSLRHSKGDRIDISLKMLNDQVTLEVRDNGIGLDAVGEFAAKGKMSRGMGLGIMQYRAGLIGGMLHFGRGPSGGTVVRCTVSRETRRGH